MERIGLWQKGQEGFSALGWLVTILVGGFVLMVVLKLGPLYLDDYAITRVVSSLDDKPGIESAGVPEVRDWLNKGLQTNRVDLDTKEVRVFRDSRDKVNIAIDYKRRLTFMYNVDLIVSFEHDWKVKSQ